MADKQINWVQYMPLWLFIPANSLQIHVLEILVLQIHVLQIQSNPDFLKLDMSTNHWNSLQKSMKVDEIIFTQLAIMKRWSSSPSESLVTLNSNCDVKHIRTRHLKRWPLRSVEISVALSWRQTRASWIICLTSIDLWVPYSTVVFLQHGWSPRYMFFLS